MGRIGKRRAAKGSPRFQALLFAVLLAAFAPEAGFAQKPCPTSYAELTHKQKLAPLAPAELKAAKALLTKLKYDPSVAQRILSDRPDLARQLLEMPAKDAQPITLYRGIAVTPEKYVPTAKGGYDGDIHFSNELSIPMQFALGSYTSEAKPVTDEYRSLHPIYATILRVQVPSFMAPVKAGYEARGAVHVATRANLQDESTFISSFGAMRSYGQASAWKDQVDWYAYDKVFKNGKFKGPLKPIPAMPLEKRSQSSLGYQ